MSKAGTHDGAGRPRFIETLVSCIKQWLQPHFRLEMRGLTLYTLWPQGSAPSQNVSGLPRIGGLVTGLGLWEANQLVWQVPQVNAGPRWLSEAQIVPALDALTAHAAQLIPAATPTGGHGAPAYRIYHIEKVHARVPRRVLWRILMRQRQTMRRDGEVTRSDPIKSAIEAKLGSWRNHLGIADVDPRTGWSPGLFSHYDHGARRRGWLIVGPDCALVVNVRAGEVDTLATLLQPRDMDPTTGGIRTDDYQVVLARVAQWNGTQDVFEPVGQLERLVEDGRRSTIGQLALNFSLAAIGVLLALYALPTLAYGQIVPIALLATASIFFACYATWGKAVFQVLGLLAFVAALAVGLALWMHRPLPFLPRSVSTSTPLPPATAQHSLTVLPSQTASPTPVQR